MVIVVDLDVVVVCFAVVADLDGIVVNIVVIGFAVVVDLDVIVVNVVGFGTCNVHGSRNCIIKH